MEVRRRSGGAGHRLPLGERAGAEQTVMSGAEQMTPDPKEILDDAVD